MLGRRKAQELTDDQMIDWLASQVRMLKIVVLVQLFGLIAGAVYIVSNDRYLAGRREVSEERARLQACATIYDSTAGNPYVEDLIKKYPDCGERARRDGRPSVTHTSPKPKPSASAGAARTSIPTSVPRPDSTSASSSRSAPPVRQGTRTVTRTQAAGAPPTRAETTKRTPTPAVRSTPALVQVPCLNLLGLVRTCP